MAKERMLLASLTAEAATQMPHEELRSWQMMCIFKGHLIFNWEAMRWECWDKPLLQIHADVIRQL